MTSDRNTIFISYPSDDGVIADAVSNAIINMPSNGLDLFLDRVYIKGGARIPDTIRESLKKTIYFVAIGTNVARRNFDWCGQELGFYQATRPDDDRLETCLYDKTIPELFVERKSFKAQSLKPSHLDEFGYPIIATDKSEFYNFLIEIANLNFTMHPPPSPEKYYPDISVWAKKYANDLADSFFTALQSRVKDEWYPQGRLELSITRGDFYKDSTPSVPLDAQASISVSTYKIFKAAAPVTLRLSSWDAFTNYVKDKTGSDVLIRIISDIVISALPDKDEAKNDYVFQAPNEKFYRVLLVKHSVYGDKRRDLIINFVETLEKVKSGDEDTTTLVAGIVLASKYRSMFVEQGADYGKAKLESLNTDELTDKVKHMLRDIDRISADAASDGLADYSALQVLLGDTLEVKDLFRTWSEVFPAMENSAKQFMNEPTPDHRSQFFAAFDPFLDVSHRNNTTFLELCMDEYRKRL
jgi:hypothetical protein